jgi:NADH-quinone oxidoreductase subunit E
VLAGFPDDRADEGPAAGPASLVGLKIAREKGWTAGTGADERAKGENA